MLQILSTVNLADNSGAKSIKILSIPGVSRQKYATVGDVVSAVVRGVNPASSMEDGTMVKAVIVRTRKEVRRVDGSYVRFDDNAAVIVSKAGDPVGTRVLGPIAREVKEKGFRKVASLAKEVW